MPLCIAGMHRSGTSMVARLLNHCGLDLGPEEDLLPPAPDNPEGFWENRGFFKLNNAILKALGGRWDRPPPLPQGWPDSRAVRRLRARAADLVRGFREPWGWKDPRNCLTLPFWKKVLPGVRTLVCVRNPLAVAQSLREREGTSLAACFDLWLTYHRHLLAAVPGEDRVVTHFDSYFDDPVSELRRVLALVGMDPGGLDLAGPCSTIRPRLAHHRATVTDLAEAGASDELVESYLDLCVEAGPVGTTASRPLSKGPATRTPARSQGPTAHTETPAQG
jgi:hypothetical protein